MKKLLIFKAFMVLFCICAYAEDDLTIRVGMKLEDAQKMLQQAGAQEVVMDMFYPPEGFTEILKTYGLPDPDGRALAITSKKEAKGFFITNIQLCTNCDLAKKFRDWHTVGEVNLSNSAINSAVSEGDLSYSEEFTIKRISPREFQMPFFYEGAAIPKTMFKVDFQDGFNNERVMLYVDGKQVFSKTITSNALISLADSVKLQRHTDNVNLAIILPEKRTKWSCNLDLSKGSYIGIQQAAEQILVNQSKDPFLYE